MASVSERVLDRADVNVGIFAFLLNLPWEFWQVPFFHGMASAAHWEATLFCTRAAAGDSLIAIVACWIVAAVAGSSRWIQKPTRHRVAAFVAVALAITVLVEWLSTRVLHRWTYADAMPVVPLIGTGLLPLLQWIVIAPLIVWFVRRQLA